MTTTPKVTPTAQLKSIDAMCAMIEEREWAEHVGEGATGQRVEACFTQLHNDITAAHAAREAAEHDLENQKHLAVVAEQNFTKRLNSVVGELPPAAVLVDAPHEMPVDTAQAGWVEGYNQALADMKRKLGR